MVILAVLLRERSKRLFRREQDVETANSLLSRINMMLCTKGQDLRVEKVKGAVRPGMPPGVNDGSNLLIYVKKLECHTGLHPLQ